jgi:hypothetical protein
VSGLRHLSHVFAVAALVTTGCVAVPGNQGNPNAPVLVTGRVVDREGKPIGGTLLELQLLEDVGHDLGQAQPAVFSATFTTSSDGTFAIHLAPTPALTAVANRNGGFVDFDLFATIPHDVVLPYVFLRQLAGSDWADAPPNILFDPNGSGEEPPVTLPPPAGG